MRILLLIVASALFGTSCAYVRNDFVDYDYQIGTDRYVPTGDVMLSARGGQRNGFGHEVSAKEEELRYGGRERDTVFIDYREFFQNIARPAFAQRTSHDIGASVRITIRGITMDVLEADANGIRFVVVAAGELRRIDYPTRASK